MKQLPGLLALVLGCTLSLAAQDAGKSSSGKGTEMTGVLCDAKCVKQDAGKAQAWSVAEVLRALCEDVYQTNSIAQPVAAAG